MDVDYRFLYTVSKPCDRWEWSEGRRLLKRNKTPTVDISSSAEALGLPFSEEDWKVTPIAVRYFIIERYKRDERERREKREMACSIAENLVMVGLN